MELAVKQTQAGLTRWFSLFFYASMGNWILKAKLLSMVQMFWTTSSVTFCSNRYCTCNSQQRWEEVRWLTCLLLLSTFYILFCTFAITWVHVCWQCWSQSEVAQLNVDEADAVFFKSSVWADLMYWLMMLSLRVTLFTVAIFVVYIPYISLLSTAFALWCAVLI